MERRELLCAERVNVSKSEHILEAVFTPAFEAAASVKGFRIFECAKENVPKRNIGKIISVMTEFMVDLMRFGTLKDESQPWRRPNIPVIEKFTNGYEIV